jgi:hypothetical protein
MTHFIPPTILKTSLSLLAASGLLLASPARADHDHHDGTASDRDDARDRGNTRTHIAVDFDFGSALSEPGTSSGGGGALRLGQELDLALISLTPELGGSYHGFGGDAETRIYTGFLGGRLAVGKIIEPAAFAHLGVGRVEGTESRTAPVMDGGLAIDLTLLPLIDLGVHGAYNVMFPRDDGNSLKWVTLGAHAALVL